MSTGFQHADVLQVEVRETRGTRHARRMRRAGRIPAILYGHGEENVSLAIPADQVAAILRHGGKVVALQGDVTDSALIRDVQWDTLGMSVLHLDLARVSAEERVETRVPLELRGEAPGTHDGGIVEHMLHEIEIECPVAAIPDKITIRINHLQLNEQITADQVQLPEGARLLTDPGAVVVQCTQPLAVAEPQFAGEAQEPEVIGRKAEAEEEGGAE
jgi:large subunit ribosomal protein L25